MLCRLPANAPSSAASPTPRSAAMEPSSCVISFFTAAEYSSSASLEQIKDGNHIKIKLPAYKFIIQMIN
jgi:hypothetical protein